MKKPTDALLALAAKNARAAAARSKAAQAATEAAFKAAIIEVDDVIARLAALPSGGAISIAAFRRDLNKVEALEGQHQNKQAWSLLRELQADASACLAHYKGKVSSVARNERVTATTTAAAYGQVAVASPL